MNDMQKNVLELIDNGTLLCVDAYESAIDNQTALGSALPKGILQKDAILNNTESVVDVRTEAFKNASLVESTTNTFKKVIGTEDEKVELIEIIMKIKLK